MDRVAELQTRLDLLERRHRRVVRALSALMLVLGAALLMGQAGATPAIVTAKGFVVADDDGKPMAKLVYEKGSARLVLRGPKTQATLDAGEASTGLTLTTDEGGMSFFSMETTGLSQLFLSDRKGKTRVSLGADDTSGSVVLHNDKQNTGATIFFRDQGGAGIWLKDKQEKTVWRAP